MGTFVGQLVQLEEQVIETFRVADAVTPETAIVPPAWPKHAQRQIFKRFSRKRALVATPDGRVWLDETRYFAYMKWRWRALTIYTVGVVVVVICAIIFIP
jgi:hypothetical protein